MVSFYAATSFYQNLINAGGVCMLMGWDPATGGPTPAKMKELGLDVLFF